MKIQPFGERVAIRIIPIEEVTESGLVLTTSKESNRGEVISLGEDVPPCISIGDKVIYNRGAGLSYTDGSFDFKVLGVKDILCKIIEE